MADYFGERRVRKRRGEKVDSFYVNIPQEFIKALEMPWSEFWKMTFVDFTVRNGQVDIKLNIPRKKADG